MPDWYEDYEEDEWEYRVERFADPGGDSALHPATADNPRNLPCPTCKWPNRLTRADVARGYQCDSCANAQERGMDIDYYEGDDELEPGEPSGDPAEQSDAEIYGAGC